MKYDDLHMRGWCEFQASDTVSLSEELLDIAKELGHPVALRNSIGPVQQLVPTAKPQFKNSLSSKYKEGEFPLHIDTAHWTTPCRYIVLGCLKQGESQRKTNLVIFDEMQISDEERLLLMTEPFRIVNGRQSFYGTILAENRPFLRYDPGCMAPTNLRGEIALSVFASFRTKDANISIDWVDGKIVVIDNWRVMHGRGTGSGHGAERIISRVLVI
jgi:hypothetical protein